MNVEMGRADHAVTLVGYVIDYKEEFQYIKSSIVKIPT
jgi:hypothetical protein